ncbi:MAG: hypothetical protein NTY50_06235 [Methylobacter sp.]|nr:hypothetical protein [Methylobacter sp.]
MMKISPEFEQHLAIRDPGSTVQAVLLISAPSRKSPSSRQDRIAKRGEMRDRLQAAAELALFEIDQVLARFGGRRLADSVDALGSLPVETTPAGIRALANNSGVQAILENQKVSPMH